MNIVVKNLRFAWSSRRAWWFTATARTKERFARTFLGSFWLGLSNLLSIAALATVYGSVFKVKDFDTYVVFLGTGLVIWNSIATAIQSAPNLFRVNAGNIKNTNIHPIFFTLEEWAFQVQTFFQSFVLVLVVLMAFNAGIFVNLFTAGWLPMLNFLLFLYWFPLLLCLLGTRYEDLYQLIPIVLQLMFLLSPILYYKEALGSLSWTADLNPVYRVLSNLRHALLHGEIQSSQIFIMFLLNIIGFVLSIWLLERHRSKLPFLV